MNWVVSDLEDEISYKEIKEALLEGGSMGLSAQQAQLLEAKKYVCLYICVCVRHVSYHHLY